LFFANDSDASPAARGSWFHNVHIFVVVQLSLVAPTFVVLGEKICGWSYFKVFSVSAALTLNITPQIAFVANIPCSSKVVDFLELVHVLEFTGTDEACPKAVPGCSVTESEASEFECVDNAVVGVG
jgi:hypothetical protein